ncbi:MAG: hypothetical protein WD872_03110 [Pirellulaceae bacterium]
MTITINLSPELERELRETSAAQGIPAEALVVDVLSERLRKPQAQPRPPNLSPEESKLFEVINQGMSEKEWERYHSLIARRQADSLTEPERQELIALCDRLEELNAGRMENLAKLACLRGVTLDQIMTQLGIRRYSHE